MSLSRRNTRSNVFVILYQPKSELCSHCHSNKDARAVLEQQHIIPFSFVELMPFSCLTNWSKAYNLLHFSISNFYYWSISCFSPVELSGILYLTFALATLFMVQLVGTGCCVSWLTVTIECKALLGKPTRVRPNHLKMSHV